MTASNQILPIENIEMKGNVVGTWGWDNETKES